MTKLEFFDTLVSLIKKYIYPHLVEESKYNFGLRINGILERSSFIDELCIKLECTNGHVKNINVFRINDFNKYNLELQLGYLEDFLSGNKIYNTLLSNTYSIHIIFYIGQFKYNFYTNELWAGTSLNILRDIFFNSNAFLSNTIADNYWS